jgi:porin
MRRGLVLGLCLCCGISARGVRAQELPGPVSGPPQPLEVREGWLKAQDLFQLPPWLELGVEFNAEPMLNPSGGAAQQGNWIQQTTATVALGSGLGKPSQGWSEADHWRLDLTLNHYSGNPDYNLAIGALFPLQEAAFPPGFWLSEVSVGRQAGEGWFGVKGGIVPLNPEFVAAPILDFYVHSALNNTLNITLNDLPISPFAAAGGIVTLQPAADVELRYGLFNLDSVLPIAQWMGVTTGVQANNGWAQMLQVSYSPAWLAPNPATPLQRAGRSVQRRLPGGLIQFGGYRAPEEGSGVYGTVSWGMPTPLGLDTRLWLGGHVSADPGDGTGTGDLSPQFIGGGLVSQGLLPGRPLDLFILGLGRSGINGGSTGLPDNSYEGVIELGYQWQFNQSLAVQPTLQWIVNPGGAGQLPGILAAGMKISLSF